MRMRPISLTIVLALVLAACASTAGDTTTTGAPEPTTTTAPPVAAVPLSYSLEPGSSFSYDVDLDQQIEMTAQGDSAALGEEEVPGHMSVHVTGTTTFTQTVAEGPEPGTYAVTIKGDFVDLTVEGTIDGEPVESGDIPDFAQMAPIDVTVVVDELGNPVAPEESLDGLLGDGLGSLGSLGDLSGMGTDLGRLIGPPLGDEPVTVGDTWSDVIETPMPMTTDAGPITTEITSEVTGTDTIDGAEVFVIETHSVTSAIGFDLADFLVGFLGAFLPEDATEEDQAKLDALMQDLRFRFDIDETPSDLTTWFDDDAGYARRADVSSSTHLVMDLNMPDDTTGAMIAFTMDMSLDQSVGYRLVSTSGA